LRYKAEITTAGGAARGAQQRAEKKKRKAEVQAEAEKLWKCDPTLIKPAIAEQLCVSEDFIRENVRLPAWVKVARRKKRQ
jgi:hypothetical protein